MKRKPRSLFKARMRGRTLYVGPEFVGPQPNYIAAVERAAAEHPPQPGTFTEVLIFHDDDCAIFDGGCCDCDPRVEFRTPDPAHRGDRP
jgi:hypothetical protein